MNRIQLQVNIDHIATLRQARGTDYPDIVEAAHICEDAGAAGITVHLREDRRHIQDNDVIRLRKALRTRLNLEMANAPDVLARALEVRPDEVCLVPERREELTTEGGLDAAAQIATLRPTVRALQDVGAAVSLFIEPDARQIEAALALGATHVEFHTGAYCRYTGEARDAELARLHEAARLAHDSGIIVNAGHGLTAENVADILDLAGLDTLNIGHSIICRAVILGLSAAVREMLAAIATLPQAPSRALDAHKTSFGRLQILGGSNGMTGAPALAALGALRAGCGLVSVLTPRNCAVTARTLAPEAKVAEMAQEEWSAAAVEKELASAKPDAIVAGMGMGTSDAVREIAAELLHKSSAPLVIDADALSVFAGGKISAANRSCVITPHAGEAARLLGITPEEVQADRISAAKALVKLTGAVVVLKGNRTIIAAADKTPVINSTGNPHLATGGTGDVLAGIIGALLARGMSAFDAAILGVHRHGLAGDRAAEAKKGKALLASDITNFIDAE